MRVKQIWNYIPLPAKLKLLTDRITLSRLTIGYAVFSLLHCVIQIAFQVEAFKINADAARFLNDIISQGNATADGFTVLGKDLRLCDHVPSSLDVSECEVIWNGKDAGASKSGTAAADNVEQATSSKAQQSALSSYMSMYVTAGSLSASTTVVSVSTLSSAPASSAVVSSSAALSTAAPVSSVLSSSILSSSPSSSIVSSTSAAQSTSASSSSASASASQSSSVAAQASGSSSSVAASSAVSSAAAQTQSSAVSASVTTSLVRQTQSSLGSALTSTSTVVVTATPSSTALPTQPKEDEKEDDDDDDSDDEDDSDSDSDSDSEDDDDDDFRKRAFDDDGPRVVLAISSSGQTQVQIDGLSQKNVTLSNSCLLSLNWPVAKVDNTKREDLVFIGFSVWVLGMSFVAILNESPPHIVASFLTHVLATAWSGFQIAHTNGFRADFSRLTTHGACGINLLPTYWDERARFEIPTLAMNVLGLVISAILSWRLMKSFGWQTFKRIGASLTISRAYRSILIFSIGIQLSVFFIVASVALWVDQVYNGDIASLTTRSKAFRAVTILVLVLVIPWLTTGWIAVRREYRIPMLIFLSFSFLYLVGWGAMFSAATFRWTFVQWRFFSLMASASVFLTIITLALGIVCRLNFGKGLPRYLNSQEPLPGDDFEPALPYDEKSYAEEKVAFPSYETPIPTFAAAYGTNVPVPQAAHMTSAPRILGPRFFMQNNNDISGTGVNTVTPFPPPAYGAPQLTRNGTAHSATSSVSSSIHSDLSMKGKRWVIE